MALARRRRCVFTTLALREFVRSAAAGERVRTGSFFDPARSAWLNPDHAGEESQLMEFSSNQALWGTLAILAQARSRGLDGPCSVSRAR
jgi:hypothetical protein